MIPILRNFLAALVGVVAGVGLIAVAEAINLRLYPLPPGFDPANTEQMKHYSASLPATAFLVVLAGYLVGITVAVGLAARLSGSRHARQGGLVAAFFGAASLMNLRAFEHPVWFWAANFAILLAALWVGLRFGLPRTSVGREKLAA